MKIPFFCVLLHLAPIFGDQDSSNELLPGIDTCGLQTAVIRIVGGTATALREYPWMALLQYKTPNGTEFSCGGSLINNRYVLTAAHCITNIDKSWTLFSVRLGEHDLDKEKDCDNAKPGLGDCTDKPVDIDIEEKIVHAQYESAASTHQNDIALLRLNREVTFSDSVMPICLPTSIELQNKNFVGVNLTVAGWGRTENSSQSNVKLKVEVPVKPINCLLPYITLIENQLCAGGLQGKDSCTGDSGGPLMFLNKTVTDENWFAVGIVSFGPENCGLKNAPSVYTKVAPYVSWIQSKLKP